MRLQTRMLISQFRKIHADSGAKRRNSPHRKVLADTIRKGRKRPVSWK